MKLEEIKTFEDLDNYVKENYKNIDYEEILKNIIIEDEENEDYIILKEWRR